jgi:hypothetical protein
MRTQVTLIVKVDLDDVPGAFHTAEQAQRTIQYLLDQSIPHYNPEVELEAL